MARVLSGVQPTGAPHIGNYLGAWSRWARDQQPGHFFCVVDLHAMTVPYEPAQLRARTADVATWLLACGLDPDVATVFVQSHVREHSELAWILNCVATMGELQRMTQFKEKSEGRESVTAGLFTYPVLQAADILLYQAEEVPIGDDQRQHLELCRDVAQRFNHHFGETFTVPVATFPKTGARVMDLQNDDKKMSKSLPPTGTILLSDDEPTTRKKIKRAVTDSGAEVRAAPDKRGVTNLLDLMAAVTGKDVADLEAHFVGKGYGDFKAELAEAVNGVLRPVRDRYAELCDDRPAVEEALVKGADRAREVAATTMVAVRERVGFFKP
ncbi:MAG TPA: tryptophan--tRNA ligase [Egibacteraceae bacterium]|nr:tryptophan--tRNA ligase [Egibacteraceae bacterium]